MGWLRFDSFFFFCFFINLKIITKLIRGDKCQLGFLFSLINIFPNLESSNISNYSLFFFFFDF